MDRAIGKWCLGLPYEGVRQLSTDEVEHLRLRIESFRKLSAIYAVVFAALLVATLAYLRKNGFFFTIPAKFDNYLPVFLMTGVLTPLTFVMSVDFYLKTRALKSDLLRGFIYQFSGIIGGADEICRAQRSLIKSGLLSTQGNVAQQVEVLPDSGVVFKANRTVPARWYRAEIGEAVSVPKRPFVLALPKEMLGISIVEKLNLVRRRMSPDERTELQEHIQRLHVPQASFVLYAVFLTSVFMLSYVHPPTAEWLHSQPGFLALIAFLFLLMLFVYVTDVLKARKLTKDSELGWLIIFPLDGKPAFKGSDPAATQAELLPISFGAWNVAGKPSLWRLMKSEAA